MKFTRNNQKKIIRRVIKVKCSLVFDKKKEIGKGIVALTRKSSFDSADMKTEEESLIAINQSVIRRKKSH